MAAAAIAAASLHAESTLPTKDDHNVASSIVAACTVTATAICLIVYSWRADFLRAAVYLNWLCHPSLPRILQDCRRFFHAHPCANIETKASDGQVLAGWHLPPAGRASRVVAAATVAGGEVDESAAAASDAFASGLAESRRVIIFFHGVSGCRGGVGMPSAAPSGRVACIRALATHFDAHVVVFECVSGGRSTARPMSIFHWLCTFYTGRCPTF